MARKYEKLSKKTKAKISLTLLGRRCCPQTEWAKGHIPWNKGIRGLTHNNKTSFKKGNIPQNYHGGFKITEDGIYKKVEGHYNYTDKEGRKFRTNKYESLARIKYREAHGDFPKGMVLYHKDGDIMNSELDNLELITRSEMLRRNQNRIAKCRICGKEFRATGGNHIICSDKKCKRENGRVWYAIFRMKNPEAYREYQRRYRLKKKLGKVGQKIICTAQR
jgi:hypothetical protein